MGELIAKPFLKWAGGKTQLIKQLIMFLPEDLKNKKIDTYFEPFIGGGALFFYIAQNYNIPNLYLSDINEELILVYRVIQKDVDDLIELLSDYYYKYMSYDEKERENFFYQIREHYNNQRKNIDHKNYSNDWILRASQVIFLNKTCFNGLFRLNKSGGFNVPFGGYKNPNLVDKNNFKAVSKILNRTNIEVCDFSDIKNKVTEKSFIYYDPPYRPISETSSFTSYSKYDFTDREQKRLANFFEELDKIGAKQMLSNSNPKNNNPKDNFFEKLYDKFNIYEVKAIRAINSNPSKRGKISELVITNYERSKECQKKIIITTKKLVEKVKFY